MQSVCGVVVMLMAVSQLCNSAEADKIVGLEFEGQEDTILDVVRRNDPQQIRDLLEAGADVHSEGPDGKTSLMHAASWGKGKDKAIPVLLDAGARIDQVDHSG